MNYLQLSPAPCGSRLFDAIATRQLPTNSLGATVTVEISYYVFVDAIMTSIVHARAEEMTPIDV